MLTEKGQKELNNMSKNSGEGYSDARSYAGCTATVALVTNSEIYCCNAGDSRTVLSKSKVVQDLSKDHKPDDIDEYKRIHAAGGFVEDSRVNGMLALSRALGDFEYK
jgi:protein phosphatase 2C family protein 2/3